MEPKVERRHPTYKPDQTRAAFGDWLHEQHENGMRFRQIDAYVGHTLSKGLKPERTTSDGYRVDRVTTSSNGTTVTLSNPRDMRVELVFFDKNRNGKLDEGDKMVVVRNDDATECDCSLAAKGRERHKDAYLRMQLTPARQQIYGRVVSALFSLALKQRSAILQNMKPHVEGTCAVQTKANGIVSWENSQVAFMPPLSSDLTTPEPQNLYTREDLRAMKTNDPEEKPVVDPRRCYDATHRLEAVIGEDRVDLDTRLSKSSWGDRGLETFLGIGGGKRHSFSVSFNSLFVHIP